MGFTMEISLARYKEAIKGTKVELWGCLKSGNVSWTITDADDIAEQLNELYSGQARGLLELRRNNKARPCVSASLEATEQVWRIVPLTHQQYGHR